MVVELLYIAADGIISGFPQFKAAALFDGADEFNFFGIFFRFSKGAFELTQFADEMVHGGFKHTFRATVRTLH